MIANDVFFLQQAYRQAARACGNSDPNPAVGAMLVDANDKVLATGFTHTVGHDHAERDLLKKISPTIDLSAATLYVTLEPCCHQGRTPPCTDLIIERRIGRVVIAERDHGSQVQGRGVLILQNAGIKVVVAPESELHVEKWFSTGSFFHRQENNRPRVILKWAQTADGYLAPQVEKSGAISGQVANEITQRLRNLFKLTLASPGTVQIDRPRLNARINPNFQIPDKLFSPFLQQLLNEQRIPDAQNLAKHEAKYSHRFFLTTGLSYEERKMFEHFQRSIDERFTLLDYSMNRLDRDAFVEILFSAAKQGFNSILVEAGPYFSQFLIEENLVDALVIYISKTRTAQGLWGQKTGRGNLLSEKISQTPLALKSIGDFQLLEFAETDEDLIYFFEHA